jgi:hypothetical protein
MLLGKSLEAHNEIKILFKEQKVTYQLQHRN